MQMRSAVAIAGLPGGALRRQLVTTVVGSAWPRQWTISDAKT